MKSILFICFCAVLGQVYGGSKCSYGEPKNSITMKQMGSLCINALKEQINMEFSASMKYMALGSYFNRDTINRPGFSKFFMESASEERQHGIKLIQYLLMRGYVINSNSSLIDNVFKNLEQKEKISCSDALKLAFEEEEKVTANIIEVIKVCEEKNPENDYHLVDYLTGDFLQEQYESERTLAGKIWTLMKMSTKFSEFLFDKKLLKGEV